MSKIPSRTLGLILGALSASLAPGAEVARISIEVTAKGEATIVLARSPDADFEAAEGKPARLFGVPAAEVKNDEGFIVITHAFDSPKAGEAFGSGLRVEEGALIADTSVGKDNIGPRAVLSYPRSFGLPFTIEMDVVRQGSISRREPTQAGRSMNLNLGFGAGEQRNGHLYVSCQATDTRYGKGLVIASWARPGGENLVEMARTSIKDGAARLYLKLPDFPEKPRVRWWDVIRGDNASLKRLRCAGPLVPSFGMELAGSAGQVSVKRVLADSPAAAGGVKDGDRLIQIADERIRDVPTALNLLATSHILSPVKITVSRDGKPEVLTIQGQ